MEMVLEAEIVKLAYQQFQATVQHSQTSSQMTFTEDQQNLFLGHQLSADFGSGADWIGTLNISSQDYILQSSAMFSTTNKWFGLAQLNLEAILASTEAKDKCDCSAGWADCKPTTLANFNASITEFWPTGNNIGGEKDICALLQGAYAQAMRVAQERQAAM